MSRRHVLVPEDRYKALLCLERSQALGGTETEHIKEDTPTAPAEHSEGDKQLRDSLRDIETTQSSVVERSSASAEELEEQQQQQQQQQQQRSGGGGSRLRPPGIPASKGLIWK